MKALILTCNTGEGHNSAGKALQEEFARRGISSETKDALSFLGKKASAIIAGAFVNIAVKTPRAFGLMYNAGEMITNDKLKSPVYFANMLFAENLYAYLNDNQIDIAVCPHLFPMEALTFLKRTKNLRTACFSIVTDYTCIPFLEETDMDRVFIPHQDLKDEFIQRGLPADRLSATGIPVLSKFRLTLPRAEARKKIGLPEDLPLFMIMTGGEGCGNPLDLAKKLIVKKPESQILVMTGRNRELQNAVQAAFDADQRVRAVDFTDEIQTFMDASDLLLTKPGGLSSTEAAVKNIPFVHTPPIPGCETCNARFFSERAMSVMTLNDDHAIFTAARLIDDPAACLRMRQAQRQYINPHAASEICDQIIAFTRGKNPAASGKTAS